MRTLLIALTALAYYTAPNAGAIDVHGIVRVGERPGPNAVVWLEAPDAPRPRRRNGWFSISGT